VDVGAPKSANFLSDGETVSAAAIAAFVSAVTTPVGAATVTSLGKNPYVISLGGVRQRRKLIRKETVYRKSANLDEPGP
jgi:hypothetical protein